jgi:phage tail-like protein
MRSARGARRALGIVAVATTASVTVLAGAAWAPSSTGPTTTVASAHLVVDGVELATFSRCVGLGSTTEVVEFRSGTGGGTQLIPGDTTSDGMVCERGLTSSMVLASWREAVEGGTVSATKDATITMYDATGAPVLRWFLDGAWPSQLTNYFDEAGVGREIVTFESSHTQRVAP